MEKYFKEETMKLKLSEYLMLDESKIKYDLFDIKYGQDRIKYLIEILGDVKLDEETYELFMKMFKMSCAKYDVATKKETIKGIYDISQKYPYLSAITLELIWSVYIDDLYKKYKLDEILEKYIEIYGKTEIALEKYFEYVDETSKEYDKQFYDEAYILEEYLEGYEQELISYLKQLIIRQHISYEEIIKVLPSKELIDKDKQQLSDLSSSTRIYFGICKPISYQMIESLIEDGSLDCYQEQPQYIICDTKKIDTTFTKQDFIESIEKQKTLKLRK